MENYDVVGVGAGPANLSLAALIESTELNSIFFDKQEMFLWHPGMLLSGAKLQVSYLKDLVSLVDPTNPYSFLNYLANKGCLYQFITANFSYISRTEFSQYLQWAFENLGVVKKAEEVRSVKFDGKDLLVETARQKVRTKNLVLGAGLSPYIPSSCEKIIGDDVYHNASFLYNASDFTGKRVAIIGGGQSGAEIAHYLLSQEGALPSSIHWLSKRVNFLPIDDSPFTNELFTPEYTAYFHQLHADKKQSLLFQHKLASDGISMHTIEEIYKLLYEHRFIGGQGERLKLLPSHYLSDIKKVNNCCELIIQDVENNRQKILLVDKVILCTGYHYQEPDCLSDIQALLHRDPSGLIIKDNYELSWDGMSKCAIYIQNGARHTHGVADPNLSLLAYRSATIINSVSKDKIYPNINGVSMIDWRCEL